MKVFLKVLPLIAAFSILFATVSVSADSPGQLTGGPQVFQVKNLTKNTNYSNSTSASCNDSLKYSVRLHNAAYGGLTNIMVKVNLPNGSMTATPAEGASSGTSGSVKVSVASNGSLNYTSASSKLFNSQGGLIKNLPDTITSGGVNIGSMAGSTTEFVQFTAKVSCLELPTPTPVVKSETTKLPNTGAGAIFGLFIAATAIAAVGHLIVRRIKN